MSGKRISREKLTIKKMIDLYQAKCPQASAEPEHYEALFVYAQKRLDKCVFGEEKPACKQCPVHCYQPAKREEMKQIMRVVNYQIYLFLFLINQPLLHLIVFATIPSVFANQLMLLYLLLYLCLNLLFLYYFLLLLHM